MKELAITLAAIAFMAGLAFDRWRNMPELCAAHEEQGYVITTECQAIADAWNEEYGQ